MKAKLEDVQQMVTALFTLIGGINRASRHIPAAAALNVLQTIAAQEPARPSEVAAFLGVHQSSVTRQVQALQDKGYLVVAIDPDDRRSCILSLSEAGRAEVTRLTSIGMQRFATFVADWDAEDVQTLTRLLVRLEDSKAEVGRREAEAAEQGRRWRKS